MRRGTLHLTQATRPCGSFNEYPEAAGKHRAPWPHPREQRTVQLGPWGCTMSKGLSPERQGMSISVWW